MSILVIGGDRLGNISDKLQNKGFNEINHVSGRKKNQRKLQVPENTDIILVLTDFINHSLMQNIKKTARENEVKIIYAKRSWAHIENQFALN